MKKTSHCDRPTLRVLGGRLIPCGVRTWRFVAIPFVLILSFSYGAGRADEPRLQSATVTESLAAQPLSPAAQAYLRSMIRNGRLPELRWPDFSTYQEDVGTFYESFGYATPWVRKMQASAQAQAVIAALRSAEEKGLSGDDYDGPRWDERLSKLKPGTSQPAEADAARFDLALTICLMRYISDLHTGKINPHRFGIELNIAKRKYDLPKFLREQIVPAPDVRAALARIEPPYPGYQRTIRALKEYRHLAAEETGQPFPPVKKPIGPGETYAGAARLARFLRLVGDFPAGIPMPSDETQYEGALVDAVRSFQERHGLTPDGKIGASTLEELNVPLRQRVRQIELTLERWRWLPEEYGKAPIVVNIPGFMLRAYDADFHVAVTMKVVVGKAYDHDTPVFMSELRSVIFRPYWEVPVSIASEEIVSEIERDPAYLAKQEMEIVDSRGVVVATDTITSALLDQIREGKLTLRQRPGPNNSLGLIKFEFPNEYSVYMHDTPARLLFSRSKRDFSHGCIRLEHPVELATWVLRDNPEWDEEHIRAAMNGDTMREVKLAQSIPVLIVYGTAIVLDDGIVRFYDDLYGQDAELNQALRDDYPYPH